MTRSFYFDHDFELNHDFDAFLSYLNLKRSNIKFDEKLAVNLTKRCNYFI